MPSAELPATDPPPFTEPATRAPLAARSRRSPASRPAWSASESPALESPSMSRMSSTSASFHVAANSSAKSAPPSTPILGAAPFASRAPLIVSSAARTSKLLTYFSKSRFCAKSSSVETSSSSSWCSLATATASVSAHFGRPAAAAGLAAAAGRVKATSFTAGPVSASSVSVVSCAGADRTALPLGAWVAVAASRLSCRRLRKATADLASLARRTAARSESSVALTSASRLVAPSCDSHLR
mmetsp:Transcript_21336/g.54105  ORF Transcript_21336/g.54105 Transcript_21336/m.54105 type:complete len:241 (-) Transcript_21336:273-995(-)